MIFHTVTVDNKAIHKQIDLTVPFGNSFCGIIYEGTKPQSVTVSKEELTKMLADKQYGIDVLSCLGVPK